MSCKMLKQLIGRCLTADNKLLCLIYNNYIVFYIIKVFAKLPFVYNLFVLINQERYDIQFQFDICEKQSLFVYILP